MLTLPVCASVPATDWVLSAAAAAAAHHKAGRQAGGTRPGWQAAAPPSTSVKLTPSHHSITPSHVLSISSLQANSISQHQIIIKLVVCKTLLLLSINLTIIILWSTYKLPVQCKSTDWQYMQYIMIYVERLTYFTNLNYVNIVNIIDTHCPLSCNMAPFIAETEYYKSTPRLNLRILLIRKGCGG